MMKNVLVGIFVLLACFSAKASYLYWEITSDQVQNISGDEWITANFWWGQGADKTMVYEGLENLEEGGKGFGGPVAVNLGNVGSGYSYYIELLNSTGKLVGYQTGTYETLSQGKYIYTNLLPPSQMITANVWHGGSYNAPEPTSGLLMLLGAAVLGLRRKQRKTEE